MDICEDSHINHSHHDNQLSGGRDICLGHSASTSGRMCYSEADQSCFKEQSDVVTDIPERIATNEVSK